MKTTGTANHLRVTEATTASTTSNTFGQLSFIVPDLNFIAINGRLLVISQATTTMMPYNTHLLTINAAIFGFVVYQEINGNEAINNPAAGVGTPLNP